MLTPLVALAALSLSAFPSNQDSVTLSRVFKEKDPILYAFNATGDIGGQKLKASATIDGSVTKLLDKGKAQLTLRLKDVKIDMGGQEPPTGGEGDTSMTLDANNLPNSVAMKDLGFITALWTFAGYVPNKPMVAGSSVDIDYKTTDDTVTLKGKCKFIGLTEASGQKVAQLEITLTVTPGGDTPGEVKLISTVNPATGALLECKGTVEMAAEGSKIDLTFKKK